jgi:hypothetical protein
MSCAGEKLTPSLTAKMMRGEGGGEEKGKGGGRVGMIERLVDEREGMNLDTGIILSRHLGLIAPTKTHGGEEVEVGRKERNLTNEVIDTRKTGTDAGVHVRDLDHQADRRIEKSESDGVKKRGRRGGGKRRKGGRRRVHR